MTFYLALTVLFVVGWSLGHPVLGLGAMVVFFAGWLLGFKDGE